MKLHIPDQPLQDDDTVENKHDRTSKEAVRSYETEMKPEPLKEADDEWGRSLGSGIYDIRPSYVMTDNLEELPLKLLEVERRTVPVSNMNSNVVKQSIDLSEPSLYR